MTAPEKLAWLRDHADDATTYLFVKDIEAELEKGQKFKTYVHERLDKEGIPHHPDPTSHEGCRIGSRLDFVFQQFNNLLTAIQEECERFNFPDEDRPDLWKALTDLQEAKK